MDSNPINLANLFKQAQEAFADQFNLEQVVAGSDTRVLFVARDRVLKRKVALRIHPTPGGTSREWFEKETELMAELDHPSIRGVYSAGYKGDWAYRVTKWITGESLADAVERQPRSIPFVLHLAQDLTYALEYAHSRQIIIRRMIPSTIIIDRMPRAIITDLRYANRCLKFADPDDEPSANNFLAPETWHGGFGEPASDIYALAAIVYFALTGQPPDSNPLNIIPPSKLRAKCPAIFDRILMRALSHDARNRYFNVEDMRADLASEMGRVDTPVSAAPTNSLRSDPKAWEKHLRRALGDQYELMNELGTGGFGTVYRVRDLSLERDVALKVLHPFLTEDPTVVERFRKEAQLAAKLDHPNIVAIYGIGHRSGLWWYTMEYIPGLNLAQAIQARGPLEFDDWLTAMTQALNALHHAHQHDLVHRDLKPENMLIDSRDGNLNITDFGLALALKTELPKLQSHSGTPEFAAPEQMFGEEVDHRADLYSLSLVGYFALTGRPPFAGDSVEAVLAHKEAGDLPKVHPIRNDVPETVLWALARGASRNPEERFPTAAAYLQALQRAAHEGQTTPKSWFRNMLGGG